VVLLADARLGLTDLDHRLLEWISQRVRTGTVRLLVLLTKADKLSRKQAQAALAATTEALGAYSSDEADVGITLFSALKKTGLDDVAVTLRSWIVP
jgi:GTP-binding protein